MKLTYLSRGLLCSSLIFSSWVVLFILPSISLQITSDGLNVITISDLKYITEPTDDCGFIGSGIYERSEFADMCRKVALDDFKEDEDFDSLLYRVSFEEEYNSSLYGTILQPLKHYRNPCWISKLTDDNFMRQLHLRPSQGRIYNTLERRLNYSTSACLDTRPDDLNGPLDIAGADCLDGARAWRIRCFPYAFLIGADKSGTTDLFRRLLHHPQIFPPTMKENFYWYWGRLYDRYQREVKTTPATFNSYLSYYDSAAESIRTHVAVRSDDRGEIEEYHPGITIDGTAIYLYHYAGWEMIPGNRGLKEPKFILAHTLKKLYPGVRIIVILRNPVDRMFSHHLYLSDNSSADDFQALVARSISAWETCLRFSTIRACAYNSSLLPPGAGTWAGTSLRGGLYSVFLRDWLKVLDRDHIKILRAEDYFKNEIDIAQEVFRFLEVAETRKRVWRGYNKGSVIANANLNAASSQMNNVTRGILENFYGPFNRELVALLDDEAYGWDKAQ